MNRLAKKLMPLVSSAAFSAAFLIFGTTCRTWLYQPPTPAKLKEMEK